MSIICHWHDWLNLTGKKLEYLFISQMYYHFMLESDLLQIQRWGDHASSWPPSLHGVARLADVRPPQTERAAGPHTGQPSSRGWIFQNFLKHCEGFVTFMCLFLHHSTWVTFSYKLWFLIISIPFKCKGTNKNAGIICYRNICLCLVFRNAALITRLNTELFVKKNLHCPC